MRVEVIIIIIIIKSDGMEHISYYNISKYVSKNSYLCIN